MRDQGVGTQATSRDANQGRPQVNTSTEYTCISNNICKKNNRYFMVFHLARVKTKESNLEMQTSIFESTTKIQCFGVIIDSKCKCISHVVYINKMYAKRTRSFFRNKNAIK